VRALRTGLPRVTTITIGVAKWLTYNTGRTRSRPLGVDDEQRVEGARTTVRGPMCGLVVDANPAFAVGVAYVRWGGF